MARMQSSGSDVGQRAFATVTDLAFFGVIAIFGYHKIIGEVLIGTLLSAYAAYRFGVAQGKQQAVVALGNMMQGQNGGGGGGGGYDGGGSGQSGRMRQVIPPPVTPPRDQQSFVTDTGHVDLPDGTPPQGNSGGLTPHPTTYSGPTPMEFEDYEDSGESQGPSSIRLNSRDFETLSILAHGR